MPKNSDANVPEGLQTGMARPAHRLSLLIRAAGFMLGMLVTGLAATALLVSSRFDDQQITQEIADFVAAEYGRGLSTTEGIHLALWPWPSLRIGAASLTEPNRPEAFASWKQASFELDVLALLRHDLVIRHARIEGLTLRLARDQKGAWNFANLVLPTAPTMQIDTPFSLQLEGLSLTHASVVMEDAISGHKLQWRDLELGTDALRANRGGRLRLISRLVSPDVNIEGRLSVSTRYRFGETSASGLLNASQIHYVGDIGAIKSVDATLSLGSADWQSNSWTLADAQTKGVGKFNMKSLEWSATLPSANERDGFRAKQASANISLRDSDALKASLHLTLQDLASDDKRISTGLLAATWKLLGTTRSAQGKLAARLRHDGETTALNLDKIDGEFSLTHPALNAANAHATLKGSLRLTSPSASASSAGSRDAASGELKLDLGFGKDLLNLNASLVTDPVARTRLITARVDSKQFDADRLLAKGLPALVFPAPETLEGWRLDGVISMEKLRLGGMLMTSARIPVKVSEDKLSLPEHEIALYGGNLTGSALYAAKEKTLTLFEAMRGVQMDALSRDAKIAVPLAGQVNATLDVRSQGPNLQENANGVLRVYAKNARWLGADLPRSMLAAHAGMTPQSDAQSATPLAEISAAFAVKGPTLMVNKLTAHSDAIGLTASGNIHPAAGEMDLLLSTRAGNNRALAVLRGQRMALRAKGALMQPRIHAESARIVQSVTPAMVRH